MDINVDWNNISGFETTIDAYFNNQLSTSIFFSTDSDKGSFFVLLHGGNNLVSWKSTDFNIFQTTVMWECSAKAVDQGDIQPCDWLFKIGTLTWAHWNCSVNVINNGSTDFCNQNIRVCWQGLNWFFMLVDRGRMLCWWEPENLGMWRSTCCVDLSFIGGNGHICTLLITGRELLDKGSLGKI